MNKHKLIDANEVIEILEFYETDCDGISWAIRNIKELPAAYDIDKVVEQLEECSVNYCKEYGYAEDENVLYLPDAIEIVKGGAE